MRLNVQETLTPKAWPVETHLPRAFVPEFRVLAGLSSLWTTAQHSATVRSAAVQEKWT